MAGGFLQEDTNEQELQDDNTSRHDAINLGFFIKCATNCVYSMQIGCDLYAAIEGKVDVDELLVLKFPHVNRTDYQLIDISDDGFLSLLTENANTKDDLKLPTDDALLTQAYHDIKLLTT
ncbi:Eukaryotic translation initiation factor 5A [Artemisia annua]|uniref:Eukaryotic translation initiation factor 5A n=1 Tax=Artemisia annua TaxID=35608 RepID=A0A2U1MWI3_ARTAN|nr:Eukaryotic translation initiation factor 5A [Artemisia annua]